MKIVILQSNYIPWKGYFDLISDADIFCFYDEVQYTKNDWRNRNRIIGHNGVFWLTIPITKDSVKYKISEVKLIDHSWQAIHLRSIEQSYRRSQFRDDVLSIISPIYLEKKWTSLSELNQTIIKKIAEYIGISTSFCNSKDFTLKEGRIDRLIDLIVQLKGSTYISGPAAKNYLAGDEYIFQQNNIELVYKKYGPYLKYNPSHKIFEDNVSILDLLMNINKNDILSYIKSNN